MAREKRIAELEERLTQSEMTLEQLRSIRGKLEEFRRSVASHLSQKQIDEMIALNGDAIMATDRIRAEIEKALRLLYSK